MERSRSGLVGRHTELAALIGAVTGAPRLVLVEGEPGVGKSRLVRELLVQPCLAGRTVLRAQCPPVATPFAGGAAVEALRHTADRLRAAGPLPAVTGALRSLLPELADVLPPAVEPGRHQVVRAFQEVLAALAPAVLVIDDAQWLDPETLDLLRVLADEGPTVVLALRRHEFRELDSPPLTERYGEVARIELAPLDVTACGELAAAVVGPVSDAFVAALHHRSGGLPLEILELVREPDKKVPDRIRATTLDRVSRLGRGVTAVCRAMAVLDDPVSEAELVAVAGLPEQTVADAVSQALDAAVVREVRPGRYALRHPLATRAVYESTPGPRRREMHVRAAALLAASDPKAHVRLAHHHRYADDLPRWVEYTVAAADQAASRGDTALAVTVLEQALDDTELPVAAKESLAVRLSREMQQGIAKPGTLERLRTIVRDWPLSRGARGEIRMNVGRVLINQVGHVDDGRREIERAVADLSLRRSVVARGLASLALPAMGAVPVERNLRWLAQAEQACAGSNDHEVLAALRANRLTAQMQVADPRVWQVVADLPAAPASPQVRRQLARTYLNLADAATWNGHFAPARRHLEAARALVADTAVPYLATLAVGTELRLAAVTGDWQGLAEKIDQLVAQVGEMGYLAADALLARGWLETGRLRGGRAMAAFTAAGVAAPGMVPIEAAGHAGRARLLLARGDAVAAYDESAVGLALVRQKNNWVWASELTPVAVQALVDTGRVAEASELVAEFARGIADRDAPLAAAAELFCRAVLGRSVELFTAASEAYGVLPHPHAAATAAELAGRCAAESGDVPTAVARLRTAEAEFDRLTATADAHRCRRAVRRYDPSQPRKGRIGYGNTLSPREHEVAELAAAGLTNQEIAVRLVISRRTVEQHVGKILRKLELPSRGLLGDRLAQ